MVTITLPPDLEQAITHRAQQQQTTPELYVLNALRERYLSDEPSANAEADGETMADFFVGYAGTVNSRDIVPEGVHLSKDTGRKFKEILRQKYRDSKR